MSSSNAYDVTTWPHGDPVDDIGAVINDIVADVRARQSRDDLTDGGRPGAVIRIPPGDYRLRTQVVIDVSFLRIEGAGHGFTSSSIRFNVPSTEVPDLHELWPGGSRILHDLPVAHGAAEGEGAAFRVARTGSPRISSVEFVDFCIDGLHFTGEGPDGNPENSYRNGRTGILVDDANDSFRVIGMGLVYLEHGLTIRRADALSVHGNFIAECGNAIELRDWGQASKVTDNLVGAGPWGHSIYAERHGGLLVTANNVFPRGASSVHLDGVTRSSVTSNRLHTFYPGAVRLTGGSSENLVGANHILRDHEPWAPFQGVHNDLDDLQGLLLIEGNDNTVSGNHFSEIVDTREVRPAGAVPVIIRVAGGSGNHIANNHVVAKDVRSSSSDDCFEAQVGALLGTPEEGRLEVVTVLVDADAVANTVLDSGTDDEVVLDRTRNAFRATPAVPTPGPGQSTRRAEK
ncbi:MULTISPECIES: NosD domain-containing protein [unclassified Microbacterium]|uniref:NosD domain-containing protein n=1 Tax=unclassified Microbacterium TaxID=2609290 RepID=UPI000682E8E3|nr:NosD domain-containing protein [Microbacterium sp. GCS4]KNY04735.1 fructotransferase [Microbacterium sp. GCS4]